MPRPRKKKRTPLHHHLYNYVWPHKRNGYHPHLLRPMAIAVLAAFVLILELAYIAQIALVFPNTNFLASVLPSVLVDLTNEERTSKALPRVAENAKLDQAAQAAAEDMATNGYFAHVSPDGKNPWYWLHQAGYTYRYAGENLAVNFTDSAEVETAWLNSPTHYANIVKPQYTEVGYGVADGQYQGAETTFVVEFFAAPEVASAPAQAPEPVAVAAEKPVAVPTAKERVGEILGSQALATPPMEPKVAQAPQMSVPAPVAKAPVPLTSSPTHAGFFARTLSAPTHSTEAVLAALALLAITVFGAALFVRGDRTRHTPVVGGGAALLAVLAIALLFTFSYTAKVGLPAEAAAASVVR